MGAWELQETLSEKPCLDGPGEEGKEARSPLKIPWNILSLFVMGDQLKSVLRVFRVQNVWTEIITRCSEWVKMYPPRRSRQLSEKPPSSITLTGTRKEPTPRKDSNASMQPTASWGTRKGEGDTIYTENWYFSAADGEALLPRNAPRL